MKEYEIKVTSSWRLIMLIVGVPILFCLLFIFLGKNEYLNIYSFLAGIVLLLCVFLFFKRYIVYSVTLELFEDSLKFTRSSTTQLIHFDDIEHYQIESVNGIRVEIKSTDGNKISLTASDNFGNTPIVLEEFATHFEEQVKGYQKNTSNKIKRKASFLETTFGMLFILIVSAVGILSIIIGLIMGKGFSPAMFTILVPILIYLPALHRARQRRFD